MNVVISYVKQNWLPLCMVLIPSGLFLGPIPYSPVLYYALLIFLALLSIVKRQQESKSAILFVFVCALSILFGNPSPLFKSWMRLGLFALLVTAYFPVFRSEYFDKLRARAFPLMLILLWFTSVGSFGAYFMGINYMSKAFGAYAEAMNRDTIGWFGGLTYQSMMLGPICALALIFLVWLLINKINSSRIKWVVAFFTFITFCCLMLTASRSANGAGIFGVVILLYLKYRRHLSQIIKLIILGCLGALILSPIYMPYAEKVLSKQQINEESGSTFASRESRWTHRIEEFSEYPVLGYGFVAIDTKHTQEYMPSTGIIEPGSSWLAILSMTGIVGMICFLTMFTSTCSKLYALLYFYDDKWALLHLGILAVFSVHFIAEGYVFSGGGALCFLFWFFFGCAYSFARNPIEYSLTDTDDDEYGDE